MKKKDPLLPFQMKYQNDLLEATPFYREKFRDDKTNESLAKPLLFLSVEEESMRRAKRILGREGGGKEEETVSAQPAQSAQEEPKGKSSVVKNHHSPRARPEADGDNGTFRILKRKPRPSHKPKVNLGDL